MHKSSVFTSVNSHRGHVCNQHPHLEIKHHHTPGAPPCLLPATQAYGVLDAELLVWFSVGNENTAQALMGFKAEKQTNKKGFR